jgi:hypothetical protein
MTFDDASRTNADLILIQFYVYTCLVAHWKLVMLYDA